MDWLESNQIQVPPPRKPKKMTGTRFAAVLGLNAWTTPFETWCAITRTYEKPFEDTIYTIAGKAIEPKQAEYMKETYFMSNLVKPADVWGEDYFKKTYGDFFPKEKVFGGMWDYILTDKDGKPNTVLEMKTSKRVEDWQKDIPEYYALQAALYAYLLGVDNVIMVASFLEEGDYEHPENFVCSPNNTITRPFKLSERYPDFQKKYIKPAMHWWKKHVETGLSPAYDEKRDADILKVLRTNSLSPETDMEELIAEAEGLKAKLDANAAAVKEDEARLKVLEGIIKKSAQEQFRDGDTKVSLVGKKYVWEVSISNTTKYNTDLMKEDGVYDKYAVTGRTYKLTSKVIKEDKNGND